MEENKLLVTSPSKGETIETLTRKDWSEVSDMMDKALKAFREKAYPAHERMKWLRSFQAKLQDEQEGAALMIAREGGKPLKDARAEVARAINGVELAISEMYHLGGTEIPMGMTRPSENRLAFTTYEPIGLVVAISAFNHPVNLIIHQVIPAIATGCPVIIKPDSRTPLSAKRIVELLHAAGVPEAWCQFVVCGHEASENMATDDRTAFVTFIGSERVGWELRSKIAPGTHIALEHGGTAPVVMDKSASAETIEAMIPKLVKGGMYHAGQVCVSVQRVYVHASLIGAVTEQLQQAVNELVVGDAEDEKTDVGPIIDEKALKRIDDWVQEALEEGAELVCGGQKRGEFFYEPTILLNPSDHARVTTDEIFGPVICLYSYETEDEVIYRVNDTDYLFQAAVMGDHHETLMRLAKRIRTRAVMINDHTAFRVDWMPFGGAGKSGLGTGGIGYTMRDMLLEKLFITGC